ncbi:hypothetical protein RA267_27865, partial [Pseudomonas syringae pv. tagetis]
MFSVFIFFFLVGFCFVFCVWFLVCGCWVVGLVGWCVCCVGLVCFLWWFWCWWGWVLGCWWCVVLVVGVVVLGLGFLFCVVCSYVVVVWVVRMGRWVGTAAVADTSSQQLAA